MIEIIHKDLLARIAKFRTKSGLVETPTFVPVVHPTKELIPPKKMFHDFNCQIIITNAYLLSKLGKIKKIHDVLDFPGSIMTDSGAYQLLVYGDIQITPEEVIKFQEDIETDIAVILDVPTGGKATFAEAEYTVEETLRRATASISQRRDTDVLWVGPIQGGTYFNLVEKSARAINELDFSLYAIGSPTQLMEQYEFSKLVDLVLTAKSIISTEKPVHLFGAGHPLIFPLIVAMGCDMFDSAAYALFARNDRLLSSDGTYRLSELQENFCTCPTCSQYSISEMKQLERKKRVQVLAEHNLYICQNEIKRIKNAIREGRLWRLVESRLSSHPALVDAMNRLLNYQSLIEHSTPLTKRRAIYISSQWSLYQPEIIRHSEKIKQYILPEPQKNKLILFSASQKTPYHTTKEFKQFEKIIKAIIPHAPNLFDTIFVSPFFGLVPLEITSYYPLAQNLTPSSHLFDFNHQVFDQLNSFLINNSQYNQIFGIFSEEANWKSFQQSSKKLLKLQRKKFHFSTTDFSKKSLKQIVSKIALELKRGT
ncbi:MAG: tRNA guanosine(15) transglycosylase TgtA [Promethearchaeota archaeon]